jgi:cobalt/nickel transport system ATP-binding protein
MARDKVIEARNLKYRYPDGTIGIENVDFELWSGEKVAIIGPNGSGKSTLLDIVGGLIKPTEGNVKFFEKESIDNHELRRRVGIMLQNPDDVLFNPTVREDLEFGPAQLQMPKEEFNEILEGISQLLDLTSYLNKPPFRLSKGEKQKAALGCVLALKPDVLLLDEPFSAVDIGAKQSMIKYLNRLNEGGTTIVVTAHDLTTVPLIADRVYLLNQRVIAEGSTKDILTNAELLKNNGLEVPPLVELGLRLGINLVPLTVDEAVGRLREEFDKKGNNNVPKFGANGVPIK